MNMGFLPEMEFTGTYVRDPEITEENSGGMRVILHHISMYLSAAMGSKSAGGV